MNPHDILVKQKVELAILQHKLLKFDYVSKDMQISKDRLLEPTDLLNKHNKKKPDYDRVGGVDWSKNVLRVFTFEGIQNLKVVDYEKIYEKEGVKQ